MIPSPGGAVSTASVLRLSPWQAASNGLQALLAADPVVSSRLSAAALGELFDLGYHLKHVDTIFTRVFGD